MKASILILTLIFQLAFASFGTPAFVLDPSLASWLFAHWEESGYKVPKEGENLSWDSYVTNITDLTDIRKDDVVYFKGKDEVALGLVVETDMNDKTTVAVMQPYEDGMILIMPIPKASILSIGRPVPVASKSTFTVPTRPTLARR